MNKIIMFLPACVLIVFLSTFIFFQMLKRDKRKQFISIIKSARLMFVIFMFVAIVISGIFFYNFREKSIPIIWFTIIASIILPILISTFRYTLDKK